MAITAPPNKKNARTANQAKRVVVLLGAEDGTSPTTADEVDYLRPLRVSRQAGGRSIVSATFSYDLTKTGERLVDLKTPAKWKRIVEIRRVDDQDEAKSAVLFWGELTAQDLVIDENGESATVRASINPYHFGNDENGGVLKGYFVKNPIEPTGEEEEGEEPPTEIEMHDGGIAFNPVVDGKPRPNRSKFEHSEHEYRLWVDTESVRTGSAQTLSNDGEESIGWTLRGALDTIQKAVNGDEEWIENDDDPGAITDEDSIALKSVELPIGATLPEYLDRLLSPLGYSWFVAFGIDEVGESTRSIKVFKFAKGTKKKFLFQRHGEDYKPAKSSVPRLSVSTDVGKLANKIVCQGAIEEREITIELVKGWASGEGDLQVDQLKRSDPNSMYKEYPDAYRLWVGNEAGDYTNIRYTPAPIPDFSEVFSEYVPKRRPIDDCLTYDAKKVRLKPLVEYKLEETWITVPPEWGYQVLTDQLGIRFTGDTPPEELVELGSEARIRITGTIKGDKRIEATGDTTDSSPLGRNVRMILDVSDRFFDRKKVDDGDYKSELDGAGDEQTDTTKLQEYCDKLTEVEGAADLMVSASTFGISTEFEIGDLIEKVEGREILFDRHSEDADEERFPQVVGIVHNFEEQSTDIILASNDGVVL